MRAAGARTMLLTLSQNFSQWPPALSAHRPGLRPEQKMAWRRAVREGDALAAHDCAGALDAWSRALAIDDRFAALRSRSRPQVVPRASCGERAVPPASDLDRLPQGAPTALNDILRDVARRAGAILLDIDVVFAHASGKRLVGDDLFVDAVHLRILGHQLIAQAVTDAIRESGVAGPQVAWNPDAYVDPDPTTLLDADPNLRARENIARKFSCAAGGRPNCER